jgi:hypothetical protein
MPARTDIDPIEIPAHLLPGLSIVDVVPDDRRHVYRLVGRVDVEVRGKDPTGQPVIDGHFGHPAEDALSCYDKVVATREPLLDSTPFAAATSTRRRFFVNEILAFSYLRDVRGRAAGS